MAYKTGQSVHIALMLKNVSANQITAKANRNVAQITVLSGSSTVYQSSRTIRSLAASKIKPGQTVKLTTLWSGKANQSGVKKLSPGTYTIQVADNGYTASTTVQIGGTARVRLLKSQVQKVH